MDMFILDGVSSGSYGAYIYPTDTLYGAPKRANKKTSIPGRNGQLIVDLERYENATIEYGGVIMSNGQSNVQGLRNFLLSKTSYCRLEDSIHPDEFRMALMSGDFKAERSDQYSNLYKFKVAFDCKPQRFLKSGEQTKTFTADGTIHNPEYMTAKPVIRVYGSGVLGVGSETITIASHEYDYIDLDCDIQDAYCGTANCNSLITLSSGDFPELPEGDTGIVLGTGITQVDIKPRWWRL